MLTLSKVFLFKIKTLSVVFLLFILMSGCSENTMEIIFREDGSIEYNSYITVDKNFINEDLFREYFQNPEFIDEPMKNLHFFFEDWGGDTYEIWSRQASGESASLLRQRQEDKYSEDVLKELAYYSRVFNDVFKEVIGFNTSIYEDDENIGFMINENFKDMQEFKSFPQHIKNRFEDYFGKVSYEDETWVEEFDIVRDVTHLIILYINRIFNQINVDENGITLNIRSVSNELNIAEIRNMLRVIEQNERFLFPKDLIDTFSSNLRIQTYKPVSSHNATMALDDQKILEWDVLNSLVIRMHMQSQRDEEKVENDIQESFILFIFVFLFLLIILILAYVFLKRNSRKESLSNSNKKSDSW